MIDKTTFKNWEIISKNKSRLKKKLANQEKDDWKTTNTECLSKHPNDDFQKLPPCNN